MLRINSMENERNSRHTVEIIKNLKNVFRWISARYFIKYDNFPLHVFYSLFAKWVPRFGFGYDLEIPHYALLKMWNSTFLSYVELCMFGGSRDYSKRHILELQNYTKKEINTNHFLSISWHFSRARVSKWHFKKWRIAIGKNKITQL